MAIAHHLHQNVMDALVTGSHGFVGRHMRHWLLEEGWRVTCVDTAGAIPLDARDFFRFDNRQFDLCVHCAAVIPAADKRAENGLSVAQDLSLDAEMFQWALRTGPRRVVYFSSTAAYPAHLQRRLVETDIDLDDIRSPDGMYGLSKLVGEVQAREARRQGLDVLVVRPHSGYGADQSLNYPFPSMINRARRRADPFEVWGRGDQVRDFVHIDDVVSCVMALLRAGAQGPVNIGTGVPTSMLELARAVCGAIPGYRPQIQPLPDKPAGAPYRCADTALMETYYRPTISLGEGIRRALE